MAQPDLHQQCGLSSEQTECGEVVWREFSVAIRDQKDDITNRILTSHLSVAAYVTYEGAGSGLPACSLLLIRACVLPSEFGTLELTHDHGLYFLDEGIWPVTTTAAKLMPATDTRHFDAAVVIPANNEERYIGACLQSLIDQDEDAGRLQIIVAANACTDRTVPIVNSFSAKARERGWELVCDSNPQPGKATALNRADALVESDIRIYLDADIECSPDLIGKLRAALSGDAAVYATARLVVAHASSWVTRAYGRLWSRLPYVTDGITGAGLFAVNAKARLRWDNFPSIIADDLFVRLCFSPSERVEVSSSYTWPMVEGLRNLVRVRRRQDAGVGEVYRLYPALRPNEAKRGIGIVDIARVAFSEPIGFLVYGLVRLVVRALPPETKWSRGR